MRKLKYAMGWLPDLPDVRDYAAQDCKSKNAPAQAAKLAAWFQKSKAVKAPKAAATPKEVNLAAYFPPVEDQESIGSCTANAGVGLLEYYERRAHGKFTDASRLFLYKVTRNLLGWTGDTGAFLRTTMKAMALFGVLPEEQYPYVIARFDEEPTAFAYAYAKNFQSISYFRIDQGGMPATTVLDEVKRFLAAGYPSMFGFTVYNYGNAVGEFEFPTANSEVLGGHAVVAVGYDDSRKIGAHQGALRIRNSWGAGWGEQGYGWIPYEYILKGQADDFWSLFKADYIDSGQFE